MSKCVIRGVYQHVDKVYMHSCSRFIIQVHWDRCVIKKTLAIAYSRRKRNSNQTIILVIITARKLMGLHVIDVREDVNEPLFQSNKYSLHYCPWLCKGLCECAFHQR